jgi:hypothetical protein
LAFLSPAVVDAIVQGRQRADLTGTALTVGGDLPMLWSHQAGRFV